MSTWRDPDDVPRDLAPTVVTVGNFDGVHRGHQHVIAQARALAEQVGGRPGPPRVVAVTFDPHPIAVLRPEHAPPVLTTIEQRAELLVEAGVDDVLVLPFTREMAEWSPEDFVERVLVHTLHAVGVVVGVNFRFGKRAAGDVALLTELGKRHGFRTEPVTLDGGPQVWSSTYVRTCLAAGDVEGAAEALGRPPRVRGTVVAGDRRGRDLGFPTANVPVSGLAVPADGVYAGWLRTPGIAGDLPTALSVGTNPTYAGVRDRRVEAYVLDRADLALYGEPVEIDVVARLRGMQAFASEAELLTAMHHDVAEARRVLGLADGTPG